MQNELFLRKVDELVRSFEWPRERVIEALKANALIEIGQELGEISRSLDKLDKLDDVAAAISALALSQR
jgi:hypothetical protein